MCRNAVRTVASRHSSVSVTVTMRLVVGQRVVSFLDDEVTVLTRQARLRLLISRALSSISKKSPSSGSLALYLLLPVLVHAPGAYRAYARAPM